MTSQSNITAEECKSLCISNCTCKATFISQGEGFNSSSIICYHLTEVYTLQVSSTPAFLASFKVRVTAQIRKPNSTDFINSTTSFIKARHTTTPEQRMIIGTVVAIFAVTVGGLTFAMILWNRKLNSYLKPDNEHDLPSAAMEVPRPFSFTELQIATKGFSKKIGSGGFGCVFEGVLRDGTKVAVKRLTTSKQGKKQFGAEVKAIGNIHHKNLVRLKGFCSQKPSYLLVYEFVANGSLDKWIFTETSLDWDKRWRIALEIARGLSYLHEECRIKVLHLDIKPQNILLDEQFRVKIADFGLSKMVEKGEMSNVITMIRGTPGYMAPEWLQLRVTEKLDVYSFGVVVLEIITGLKALHVGDPSSDPRFLAAWAFEKMRDGSALETIDKQLQFPDDILRRSQVEKLLRVGLWCVQADPTQRPSMGDVVKMLEGDEAVENPPLPPPENCSSARDARFQLREHWSDLPKP